jgi:hypothetical protein
MHKPREPKMSKEEVHYDADAEPADHKVSKEPDEHKMMNLLQFIQLVVANVWRGSNEMDGMHKEINVTDAPEFPPWPASPSEVAMQRRQPRRYTESMSNIFKAGEVIDGMFDFEWHAMQVTHREVCAVDPSAPVVVLQEAFDKSFTAVQRVIHGGMVACFAGNK